MKLKLVNGLMFGVVLYLLIDKHRKKKPCNCKEEIIPSAIPDPVPYENTDPILDSTNVIEPVNEVVEPKPICPFKAFPLYFGMKMYIFSCANGGIVKVTYDLREQNNYPMRIINSYLQEKITESEFLEWDKIRQAGTNNEWKKPEEQ